jgi:hypothetical protein
VNECRHAHGRNSLLVDIPTWPTRSDLRRVVRPCPRHKQAPVSYGERQGAHLTVYTTTCSLVCSP